MPRIQLLLLAAFALGCESTDRPGDPSLGQDAGLPGLPGRDATDGSGSGADGGRDVGPADGGEGEGEGEGEGPAEGEGEGEGEGPAEGEGEGPPDPCDDEPVLGARLGVHVRDENGDPLEQGDTVAVTLDVVPAAPADRAAWVRVRTGNTRLLPDTLVVPDGVRVLEQGQAGLLFALDRLAAATITWRATVVGSYELLVVLASLERTAAGCPNPASGSGALLQLIGRPGKTQVCVDFADQSSLQISPRVLLRSTEAYLAANGVREDLTADDFIFCPSSPTIVHEVEFCAQGRPSGEVRLAGSWRADDGWEVDDFALFEVLRRDEVLADGATSQHHPGGDTFWCPEIDSLVCRQGCDSSLRRGDRRIEVLALAEATGPRPRRFDDGAVTITRLLPEDGEPYELRVTALDGGVQGTVTPDLYLVFDP